MSQDLFLSSTLDWFMGSSDRVLVEIARASGLQDVPLRNSFRTGEILAAEPQARVPPPVERLIRWDIDPPFSVFNRGFLPRRSLPPNDFNTPQDFNIRSYVETNTASVFVGTTRYYRNQQNGLRLWQRRLTEHTSHRFQYEIFAYGGIDVNALLGNHAYVNQHEVAFPGGIRPQMIRSAREFQGNSIVAIWDNPEFNPGANGQHAPTLEQLPHVIRGRPYPVYLFPYENGAPDPPPHNPHEELRRKRETGGPEVDLMLHGSDGESTTDSLVEVNPVPRLPRGCIPNPNDSNQAYFFGGNLSVLIKVESGTTNDTIISGPGSIATAWPGLRRAGFGSVDASLRHPTDNSQTWFFWGNQYAVVNQWGSNSSLRTGPKPIKTDWAPLRDAGFETVDAAFPNPNNKDEAYFFSGEKYIRANVLTGHTAVGPRSIFAGWSTLEKAGFRTVDAVLPNPVHSRVYFFSGTQYMLVDIDGNYADTIITGPKSIRDNWPSLKSAGFY